MVVKVAVAKVKMVEGWVLGWEGAAVVLGVLGVKVVVVGLVGLEAVVTGRVKAVAVKVAREQEGVVQVSLVMLVG